VGDPSLRLKPGCGRDDACLGTFLLVLPTSP